MHDDELFLRTIQDLSQKVNVGDEYDWLRASALVRQLLIDGHPLVGRVNRVYGLKLRFEVPDASDAVDEHTMVFMAGDTLLGVLPMRTVNRDGFLAAPLIYVRGRWFTTREIVDTVANALGGVHKGDLTAGSQQELSALNAAIQVLGGGAATAQIRGIGHMTIRGLKPLAEVVATKLGVSITWTDASRGK
jgi:hypothetical protein